MGFWEELEESGVVTCVIRHLGLLVGTYKRAPTSPKRLRYMHGTVPRSLRNTFLGPTRFTSQKDRERIHNCKFSTVNALRNGRLEACSQEYSHLKVSQAEWEIQVLWVNLQNGN